MTNHIAEGGMAGLTLVFMPSLVSIQLILAIYLTCLYCCLEFIFWSQNDGFTPFMEQR